MSLQFDVSASGGPPAGFYRANFVGVEPTEHEEFGSGLKFVFEIANGDHRGEEATRITSIMATLKNAAGRMLSGLSGLTLKPKVRIDLAPCVGKLYLIQVEETPSGATRISTVMPADAQGDVQF